MSLAGPAAAGHLAMLLFSALVAGSFALGARMAGDIDPAAFTAVRFALAALVLALAAALAGGRRPALPRRPWRFAVTGAIYAVYFVLMFEGLKTATPVSAAAVFTLTPLLTALLAWGLARQRPTARIALALAIGGAGALWVIFRGDLGAALALRMGRGEAVYFVGCIVHAAYPLAARGLNRGEDALTFSLGTMAAGAVLAGLWSAAEILRTDWAALPPRVWVTLVYTALFASAASVVLMQTAAMRLPAAKVMAYTYLTPSWVVAWDIALGAAPPPPVVAGGVALSCLALLLLLRGAEAQPPSRASASASSASRNGSGSRSSETRTRS